MSSTHSNPSPSDPVPRPSGPVVGTQSRSLGLPFPEIPNFKIESRLGEGGMGTVYKATQISLNRKVAVKTINKNLSDDPVVRERLKREAQILGQIQHANVVSCFDCGECGDLIYVVMEFVEGEDLGSLLKRRGHLPWREAVHILKQAVLGLDYASAVGVIHRDIKPENILLTKPPAKQTVIVGATSVVKIVDLGLAVSYSVESEEKQRLTRAGTVLGSPHYMSPEQLGGDIELDLRADIYSLGIMMYQVVSGVLPFAAGTVTGVLSKKLSETLPDPRTHRGELPVGFCQILQKMTARKRESRYASYGELQQDLIALERGDRVAAASGTDYASVDVMRSLPENNPVPEHPHSAGPWKFLAVGAAILAVGALSYYFSLTTPVLPPTGTSTAKSVIALEPPKTPAVPFTAPLNLIEAKSTRGWTYAGPDVGFGFQDEELFLQSVGNEKSWVIAERPLPSNEFKLNAVAVIPANAEHCELQTCFGTNSYLAFGIRQPNGAKTTSVYLELRATDTHAVQKLLVEKNNLPADAPQNLTLQVWDGQAAAMLGGVPFYCADIPADALASQKLRIAVQNGIGQFRELMASPRPTEKPH